MRVICQITEIVMDHNETEINSYCTVLEPETHEIGCCRKCDCDISIPDAHDGLCAVCEEVEI